MYSIDNIESIKNFMIAHKQTIAVAESVTSGHLQVAFSLADEASAFFQGGITTYNIFQKYTHLHINPTKAIGCNCVSEGIAEEMAKNVCTLFSSVWGIGITGYATLLPNHKSTGLYACYSIAFRKQKIKNVTITAPENKALDVQLFYTNAVLEDLAKMLKNFKEENFLKSVKDQSYFL
ncbi:MAG: CinA family protein [Bacteroidota bacterium]